MGMPHARPRETSVGAFRVPLLDKAHREIMANMILRQEGVGYWTTEADYKRRLDAHIKMSYWWASTLFTWGIKNGKITPINNKENQHQ